MSDLHVYNDGQGREVHALTYGRTQIAAAKRLWDLRRRWREGAHEARKARDAEFVRRSLKPAASNYVRRRALEIAGGEG